MRRTDLLNWESQKTPSVLIPHLKEVEFRPARQSRELTCAIPLEAPLVLGKAKQKLTAPQYDVVKALLDAGDAGLTKDQLVEKSHHEDARGILKRLANDPDWNKVFTLLVKQVAGIASNKKHNSSPFHTFSATI